jgi:hypothetical protein
MLCTLRQVIIPTLLSNYGEKGKYTQLSDELFSVKSCWPCVVF